MFRRIIQLRSFAQYSWSRIQVHREQKGRLPRASELPSLVRRAFNSWRTLDRNHRPPPIRVRKGSFRAPYPIDPYEAWLEVNKWNTRRESVLRESLSGFSKLPLLSVVMPVHNPPLEFLDVAIQSVTNQVYENWELCIADDGNTNPAVRTTLKRWTDQDSRIRMVIREENGNISRATNSGAELARGEFLVFLDQDDEITPDALAEIALYLTAKPETDILYSDDDKIDLKGRRYDPQFKPDWSPELLLSYMYFNHLFAIRRSVFLDLQGMRVGFEGSQDYDLALRATEKTTSIGHIPKILYHWRALPTSTASSATAKPESFAAGMRAVQEAFARRGIQGEVFRPDWARKANCGIFSHRFPDAGPGVAIIIPTRNNVEVLKACVESIRKTTYQNYRVVIVDNESDDPATLRYLSDTPHTVLRIANPENGFSFAAINNRAVEQVDTEYVLFLNNDTEVITPEWLTQMVGYLRMPGVGAVGAHLLLPDGRIQHAGVVRGYYNGMVGPAFKLSSARDNGYLNYTRVTRNYSAVTAACMLTPRSLFLEMGGFNEREFAVAYNDIDYCHRLCSAGYRIVYCPTAKLIHDEGHSRGFVDNPNEPASYRKKYGRGVDPYYNPNLSLEHERFAINAGAIAAQDLKPVRVLMSGINLNCEGAPYCQYEITTKLKEKGIIDPIVYSPTDGPLRQMYEAQGIQVEVHKHPLTGLLGSSDYQEKIAEFARQIQDWNVELVYGNTALTFYAIEAAHRLDLPSIWNPRESEPWQTYFDFLPEEIAHRALRCFGYPYKIIFDSNAARQAWQPLNSHHNFMTIHTGLDRKRFETPIGKQPRDLARRKLNISTTEQAVLIVGTVCERKGQIDLVKAVGHLNERLAKRIRCLIVGDRPSVYSEHLRQTVKALPFSRRSRIKIIPETSDVARYYLAADIFVCCSRIESFPRVILEALAMGLPIVTTPVFGIAEQVQDKVSALFYPPGNAQALADSITRLLEDATLRKTLAANTIPALNALTDLDSMVDAYGEVFREAWLSGGTRAWHAEAVTRGSLLRQNTMTRSSGNLDP
jgi:O-antigen biosynthesis protein